MHGATLKIMEFALLCVYTVSVLVRSWTKGLPTETTDIIPPPLFFVVPQPNLNPGCLMIEVSRSYTFRHMYPVGFLYSSDQLVVEAATYTTHNKHKRRTSIP
jgi:hypothetical protein